MLTADEVRSSVQSIENWCVFRWRMASFPIEESSFLMLFKNLHFFCKIRGSKAEGPQIIAKAWVVSFQWKNPDFLLENPDFILKNG